MNISNFRKLGSLLCDHERNNEDVVESEGLSNVTGVGKVTPVT
jgi:hypothetical protein